MTDRARIGPDQMCGVPGQWWDKGMGEKFVRNRFTVGYFVLARLGVGLYGQSSWMMILILGTSSGLELEELSS